MHIYRASIPNCLGEYVLCYDSYFLLKRDKKIDYVKKSEKYHKDRLKEYKEFKKDRRKRFLEMLKVLSQILPVFK